MLYDFLFEFDMKKIPEEETQKRFYFESILSKKNTNLDYVSSLLDPKRNTLRNEEMKYYNRKSTVKLTDIRSVEDIRQYLKGMPDIPLTAGISVSGSKYALPDWLREGQ